jgi:hypothetical protein
MTPEETPSAQLMASLSKRKVQTPSAQWAEAKVQTLSGQFAAREKSLQFLHNPAGKTRAPYLTELPKAFGERLCPPMEELNLTLAA